MTLATPAYLDAVRATADLLDDGSRAAAVETLVALAEARSVLAPDGAVPPLLRVARAIRLSIPATAALELLAARAEGGGGGTTRRRLLDILSELYLLPDVLAALSARGSLTRSGVVERCHQRLHVRPHIAALLLDVSATDAELRSAGVPIDEPAGDGQALNPPVMALSPDSSVPPYVDDLDFLQEEGARMQLLVDRRDVAADKEGPFEAPARAEVRSDRAAALEAAISHAGARCAARLEATIALGRRPRLEELVQRFGLSLLERDILIYLAVSHVAPTLRRFHGSPEVEDLLSVVAPTFREQIEGRKYFYGDATLMREGILEVEPVRGDLGRADVQIDPRLLDHILGLDTEAQSMADGSHLFTTRVRMEDVHLPEAMKSRAVEAAAHFEAFRRARVDTGLDDRLAYGRGLVLLFHGPPGTGKTMLAHALAGHLGKRLLLVNQSPGFFERGDRLFRSLLREARMKDAVVFFDEAEAFFHDSDPALLTEIERHDGLVVLATNAPEDLSPALRRRCTLSLRFDEPGRGLRARIWESLLPAGEYRAYDVDAAALADRFRLPGGHIKNAILAATASAAARAERGTGALLITRADLEDAAAAQMRARVIDAGAGAIAPRGGLERLVLAPDVEKRLMEIVGHERERPTLLQEWGFGPRADDASDGARSLYGRASVILFHGPPGTGKTAAAEALAFELGRPLHLLTADNVLSKYVGETAERLRAAFDCAAAADAVLLVDEADALLAARTHVGGSTDRYANADVNVLLGVLERHDGLVILTTNLASILDHALRRRIGTVIKFDRPDAGLRARLWRSLMPAECPVSEDIDVDRLAADFDITGASIERVIYRAAALAAARPASTRRVSHADLAACALDEAADIKTRGRVGFL